MDWSWIEIKRYLKERIWICTKQGRYRKLIKNRVAIRLIAKLFGLDIGYWRKRDDLIKIKWGKMIGKKLFNILYVLLLLFVLYI